jgi:hypothetical protein
VIISICKTFAEWSNETIVETPDWLVKLCIQRQAAPAQIDGNGYSGQPIPDGEFNVTLASFVGSIRRHGTTNQEIFTAYTAVNHRAVQLIMKQERHFLCSHLHTTCSIWNHRNGKVKA